MNDFDFQKCLIDQIGERVFQIRSNCNLTQKEAIQGDKSGEGGYGPSVVSCIENKKIVTIKENRNGKNYYRIKNCWTYSILSDIASNLNVSFEEIIFGDEHDIEKNVRLIFDKVASNFGTNLYPMSVSDKNFYTMKYPAFEKVTDELWKFLMFDAELSNRYEGYCLDELAGLLDPFFEKSFEEDILEYKKRENLKKIQSTKAPYRRRIADTEFLEIRNRDHRQKNFCKDEFVDRNRKFAKRFVDVLDWVWVNEKSKFVEPFKSEFINKAKEEFSMLKINEKIVSWINVHFFEIIKELKKEYSKNEVLNIGYQISDLSSKRNIIWLERKFSENLRIKEIQKEIGINYENKINELTEIQAEHWNLKMKRREIPTFYDDLPFFDLTKGSIC